MKKMSSKIFTIFFVFGVCLCKLGYSHVPTDQIERPVTKICPVCNKPFIVDFPHICRPSLEVQAD